MKEVPMYNVIGFKLNMNSYQYHNNDAENSDEPYSYRGTTDTDWDFNGIELVTQYPDAVLYLPEGEEFDESATHYYLYAIYSTGDSFGHDRRANCESLIVYKDHDLANKVAEMLSSTKNYTTSVPNGAGGMIDISCPWVGYFESLDELVVEPFSVYSQRKTYKGTGR